MPWAAAEAASSTVPPLPSLSASLPPWFTDVDFGCFALLDVTAEAETRPLDIDGDAVPPSASDPNDVVLNAKVVEVVVKAADDVDVLGAAKEVVVVLMTLEVVEVSLIDTCEGAAVESAVGSGSEGFEPCPTPAADTVVTSTFGQSFLTAVF